MSFQWIMDRSESISINRKPMVASTIARDGITRTVSRGPQPKRIEIRVPDGIPWSWIRTDIAAAEALNQISTGTITIPYAKYPWYYGNVQPGSNDTWTVRCIVFPEWTIFARDQVSWTGPFVFQEVLS